MDEKPKGKLKRILQEENLRLRRELWEKTTGYIVAALGLVAGLAWNDAVRSVIDYLFPLKANSVSMKLLYAALVTIIVVIATLLLVRFVEKKEEK